MYKNIIEYLIWLLIALFLGIGIVWVETELFLKDINFLTGFVVTVFGGLRKLLIYYLGSVIGLLLYIFFIPIYVKVIKHKFEDKKKQRFVSFGIMVGLGVLIKVIHSILKYQLNWI